jgi:hypothetical protein
MGRRSISFLAAHQSYVTMRFPVLPSTKTFYLTATGHLQMPFDGWPGLYLEFVRIVSLVPAGGIEPTA